FKRTHRSLGRAVNAICGHPFASDDRRVEDDRSTLGYQRKGFVNCEENTFHIDVEDRLIKFLVDVSEGGAFCNTCDCEQYVEFSFFIFDLRKQLIEIARVGNIRSNTVYIPSEFLHRCRQFRFPAADDENICSFCDELLRTCETDPAISTSNQRHFSIE